MIMIASISDRRMIPITPSPFFRMSSIFSFLMKSSPDKLTHWFFFIQAFSSGETSRVSIKLFMSEFGIVAAASF